MNFFTRELDFLALSHGPDEFPPNLPMTSEIDTYRECVEHLMSARSSKPISNGLPQHAAVLFESFFGNAKRTVKIFCRNLDARVFNDPNVIGAAIDALKRDVSIEIIVQEKGEATEFISQLKELKESKLLKLDYLDNAGSDNRAIRDMKQNFAVMDVEAYRFEPSNDAVKANACMNDAKTSEQFSKLFNLVRTCVTRDPRNA